mgnify:FL=1
MLQQNKLKLERMAKMNIKNYSEANFVKHIIQGILISLITTVIILLIFSILLTYTNLSENIIDTVIIIATAMSILIGSSFVNLKLKKNGFINGAIIGAIYMFILYLISSILNWNYVLNLQSIVMIALGVIFGILGGIIGVNKM